MKFTFRLLTIIGTLSLAQAAPAFDHNHTTWDTLLKKHVKWINGGTASQVDYAGFKKDSEVLDSYLNNLSAVSRSTFDSWLKDHQLAFLSNLLILLFLSF